MKNYILLLLASFSLWSCGEEDCVECDKALEAIFNQINNQNDCGVFIPIPEECGSFKGSEGRGIMIETCLEGKIQRAFCSTMGRDKLPIDVSAFGTIPNDVNVDIIIDGTSNNVIVSDGFSTTIVLPGFVAAGSDVTVNLYDAVTDELYFTFTSTITYDRLQSTRDVNRVIQVDWDDNFGWRLFNFNWQ